VDPDDFNDEEARMMRRGTMLAAFAALALAALPVDAQQQQQQKLKVGFVYVGPVGDHGWTYQHDQGRKAVDAKYGNRVQTTFVENVSEGPDAERVIEQLARTGHKLIFTTSFGFMEPTLKVAKKYPQVNFEHATGFKRASNVATYDARFYEGRYIIGQIAAKMSKSGTIGYIASFPIPEVVAGINAMMLGAQSIRPDMKIKIVWVNSWYDPGKESDAAKALIAQGADVLSQHTDSAAAMQVAQERGVLAFGQASDMSRFGPKAQLTSIIDDWSDYYVLRVGQQLDGKWKSGAVWDGLDKGKVKMAPYTNMPAEVRTMAQMTEAAIRGKQFHPFTCPIFKQDGSQVECKGKGALDDGQVASMNFYIKGIDDKVPQ
jgi:simple sugar transport system substrate-binding protein